MNPLLWLAIVIATIAATSGLIVGLVWFFGRGDEGPEANRQEPTP